MKTLQARQQKKLGTEEEELKKFVNWYCKKTAQDTPKYPSELEKVYTRMKNLGLLNPQEIEVIKKSYFETDIAS